MMDKQDWREILADRIKGLAELIDALAEPIFSFIAVTVPFVAPFVIAQITATALVMSNILTQTQANWLAGVLEGIGIVGLSGLVLAIEKTIRSRNAKWDSMIYLLGTIDVLYFLFLVSVNVLLDKANGINGVHIFIKALICVVPLMTGGIYGYYRIINREKIEKNVAKRTEYEIRQEQREDRLKRTAIKHGMNPFAPTVALNADTPQVREPKEKHASDYREKAIEFIERYHNEKNAKPSPKMLTERFGLDHEKNKGFMSTLIKDVGSERGWW